jgi:hypothetical protein
MLVYYHKLRSKLQQSRVNDQVMIYVKIKKSYLDHITKCISIAKQRLGKHMPRKQTRATIGRPFLGNGSVNTSP